MTSLQLRLLMLASPKPLFILAIAALGYFSILEFGKDQLAGFHLSPDYLAPVESTLRGIFSERYSEIALSWVTGTLGVAWCLAGKEAKKTLRIIDRR